MKSSTLLVWLLVAAYVAIDLAMIGELQVRRNEWPQAGGILGLALAFSTTTFLALWAVFGRWNIVLRTITATMGLCTASVLASHSTDGGISDSGFWLAFLLLYAGPAVALLVALRLLGFAFPSEGSVGQANAGPELRAKQFTIWGMLSLTTAIGILLAVIQWADLPPVSLVGVTIFVAVLTSSSCCLLLAAMLMQRWWLLGLIALFLSPLTGYLLFLTQVAPDGQPFTLIVFSCLLSGLTIIAVQVLKQAGYTLIRSRQIHRAMASESSDAPASVPGDQDGEP